MIRVSNVNTMPLQQSVSGADKRRSVRTPFKSRIKITHSTFGSAETMTRDISDTGVYLYLNGDFYLDLGYVIEGQVLGLPMEAPTVNMEVVRLDEEGAGLKFVGGRE